MIAEEIMEIQELAAAKPKHHPDLAGELFGIIGGAYDKD
jgi:hypothetical protein